MNDHEKLNGTEAGKTAQELDAKDGTVDGYISASVWNAYADEHGGQHVQKEIQVKEAMNSITNYSIKEAQEKVRAEKEALPTDGEGNAQVKPKMGL